MSPTRRDILKAAGGVAALLTLPAACTSVEPAVAALKIRLSMAAIALKYEDDSLRHVVVAAGVRPGSELEHFHVCQAPVYGRYRDASIVVEFMDDEYARVADILIAAGVRAFDVIEDGTGATA